MRGWLLKHKRDSNHAAVCNYLEAMGCIVIDLSKMGGGIADIICCKFGLNLFVEIKDPYKGKMTPAQVAWHPRINAKGRARVCDSGLDAYREMEIYARECGKL